MWGGTITDVIYEEPYTSTSEERQIKITFTADVSNPVLAWGGHIAWIGDWGAGNSASAISGSPYHMRLIDLDGTGGSQDRSLKNTAVIPSGAVLVKKEVFTAPPDPTNAAFTTFQFTATPNFGMTTFGLVDDNEGPGIDTAISQAIDTFGPGNMITVTEIVPDGWTLLNVNCIETELQDSTKNSALPTGNMIVQIGEVVTCTFQNSQLAPTAATASISGRAMVKGGEGVPGVLISLTDPFSGVTWVSRTNMFGYYVFNEIPTGFPYVLVARSRRTVFYENTLSLTLLEDTTDLNFIAVPLE
jgi:hypothetical protein